VLSYYYTLCIIHLFSIVKFSWLAGTYLLILASIYDQICGKGSSTHIQLLHEFGRDQDFVYSIAEIFSNY